MVFDQDLAEDAMLVFALIALDYNSQCKMIAKEIDSCVAEFMAADQALRRQFPWETDVLDRMAIDKTARVASV